MEPENKIIPAKSDIKNTVVVETYANDMAQVLENDTEGLVKKIIHGEEQHEAEKKNLSPESKKNKVFMLIGGLLVVLAIGVLVFLFLNPKASTVSVDEQLIPLIFEEDTTSLEVGGLKKEDMVAAVLKIVDKTEVKIGGVEGIELTENKNLIGLRRFLSLANSSFAPVENLLFVSDYFLMGTVNVKAGDVRASGEGFFILIKVRSAADIFDSLRAWERKMFLDLYQFIGINLSSETNYLLTKGFEDGLVDNRNARVLNDKDGNLVLAYIFADENSVVITNSADAFHELALRLASASRKQ